MKKQEKKLMKYSKKAEVCTSRQEAQKIIRKADKARAKLLVKRLTNDD
tara:strand:- start:3014 stop:3157 length:144 start_codon:yes stop_codon:yes gene_type:complete